MHKGRMMRAARLFTQAQRLTAQDQLDEALAAFDRILEARSPTAGIYLHQALALSEAARLEEAMQAMHQAIALEPHNAVLPMFLGQILFDHTHYSEARTWCENALALNPQQLRATALCGLIDLATGDVNTGYQRLQCSQSPTPTLSTRLAHGCRMQAPPTVAQQSSSIWQSRLLLVVETALQPYPAARTLVAQLLELEPGPEPVNIVDRLLTHGIMALQRGFYGLRYATQPDTRTLWWRHLEAEKAYYLNQFETAIPLYHQLKSHLPEPSQIDHRLYEMAAAQGNFRLALTHWQLYLDATASSRDLTGEEALVLAELQLQVSDVSGAATTLASSPAPQWKDYRHPYYQGLCQLHTGATRAARRSFAVAASYLHPDIATLRLHELHRVTQPLTHQPPTLHPAPPPTTQLHQD